MEIKAETISSSLCDKRNGEAFVRLCGSWHCVGFRIFIQILENKQYRKKKKEKKRQRYESFPPPEVRTPQPM